MVKPALWRVVLVLGWVVSLLLPGNQVSADTNALAALSLQKSPEGSISCDDMTEIPQKECEALKALYDSTNGTGWNNKTNWLNNLQPSTWFGVTVSGGHVNMLYLVANNLNGVLPSQLGNLTELELLDLRSNNLTGSLPESLGGLSKLKGLYLHSNQLSGSVPTTFGNLSELWKLYLFDNQLSGNIPVSFGQLDKLEELYLSQNQLTGSIPPELGNMAILKNLSLGQNQLSGSLPPELGNLSALENFDASENQLSGSIPVEFGQLVNLRNLALDHNQLSGNIPGTFSALTKLVNLRLSYNKLFGKLPSQLGGLINLVELQVDHNRFNGDVPASLTQLIHLSVGTAPSEYGLDLGYNYFKTPASPQTLANFLAVKDPDWAATQNKFIDCTAVVEIPEAECEALTALYTDTNGDQWTYTTNWFTNLQPSSWYGVTVSNGHVNSLSLASNNLTGVLPSQLGNLMELELLDLHSNNLTGSLPNELRNLSRLKYVFLNDNQISGGLPVDLEMLNKLEELNLSQNQLTGNIPPELGNMAALKSLSLGKNQLNGSLPVELGNLSTLDKFEASKNQLSGLIPTEFGQLVNLRTLALDHNQLSGAIPSGLSNLTQLIYLDLSANQLSGEIPGSMVNMLKLENLSLSNNQLLGTLPHGVGDLTSLVTLRVAHNRLYGDVPASLTKLSHLKVGAAPSDYGLDLGYNYFKTPASPQALSNFLAVKDPDWAATQSNSVDCSKVVEIPQTECEALSVFYLSTNGVDWAKKTNWLNNLQPSSWYGVKVSSGHVNALELSANQLSGGIPASLGSLTHLENLDLSDNRLSGDVPAELSGLNALTTLDLGHNYLNHPAVPQSLAAFLAALDPDWEITQAKFIPELSGTQPLMTPAGSADLSLTVTGSGFAAVSKVRWNGTDLATTYISASELKALIPAAKMIAPGSAALTVYNPVPGGGTSAALAFVIYTVGESGSSTLLDPVSPSLLTVNGADPAHQTSINVPAGAVSSSTQLTFMEEPAGAAGQPSGFAFGGRHFSLTAYVDGAAQPHFTFQQPVRLTLTYPANLPDFLADGLELRYWNSEAGKWQTDGITLIGLDKTKHQAVVEITHLSEFELLYRAKQLMLPVINN